MQTLEMTEVGFVAGGLEGSSDVTQLVASTEWGADWVVRFDAGGSWLDTGFACVSLNQPIAESAGWSSQFSAVVNEIRNAAMDYGRENCAVNASTSPPFVEISCRLLGK